MMSESAMKGCEVLLHTCAGTKKGEKVLVITDDSSKEIGLLMYQCASAYTDTTLVLTTDRTTHGDAPTDIVRTAMATADVIFSATKFSLYNTSARIEACKQGARFVNMADYSHQMLEQGCLFVDFEKTRTMVDETAKKIVGERITITTPAGTNFTTSIIGRKADVGYGMSLQKGEVSSPPDIECAVGPADNSAEGILVIDGSIPLPNLGLIEEPIFVTVEKGYITKIEGGKEADILRDTLASFHDERVYLVAEVGFGMNQGASLSGRMLEDEGVFGTIHIGIGNNLSYGGSCDTPIHIDMIMNCPTCTVDSKLVYKDGKLI